MNGFLQKAFEKFQARVDSRERKKWERLSLVMNREGGDAQTSEKIYMAVVQAVMISGSDTWAMTLRKGSVLGGFNHRVDHRIMGRQPWR